MKMIMSLVAGALGLGLLIALAGYLYGPQRVWLLVAGEPDTGRVTLESLERTGRPNDALIAPEGRTALTPDAQPPVFNLPPERLYAELVSLLEGQTGIDWAEQDETDRYLRFVTYSPTLRFPDLHHVWVLETDSEETSTLALYAGAQLGQSDLGKNRARLDQWLTELAERIDQGP